MHTQQSAEAEPHTPHTRSTQVAEPAAERAVRLRRARVEKVTTYNGTVFYNGTVQFRGRVTAQYFTNPAARGPARTDEPHGTTQVAGTTTRAPHTQLPRYLPTCEAHDVLWHCCRHWCPWHWPRVEVGAGT